MPLGYLRNLRRGFGAREAGPASSPLQQDDNKKPQSSVVALEPFPPGHGQYQHIALPANQPLLYQQTLEYQGHNGLESSPPAKSWRPLMLRRGVLLAFAVVFVLLIVSLEIILKVSTDRDGFGPTDSKLYYVWTYGPTAVFTIIAAFWTQVDYRTRQMQPWEEMAKKPQPAAKSLLMDYISPNPVVSFFSSLRHCHWPVATALFGSLLIKVLIIVSTGVFILRSVALPHEVSMDLAERFDFPSAFNATGVDDTAGLMYSGVLLDEIEYLPGTNAEYATELFNSTNSIKEDVYDITAIGKSFTADLSCERATIDPKVTFYCPPESGCTSLYVIMEARSESCHMSKFPRNNRTFTVTNNGVPFGSWFGAVLPGRCDGDEGDPELDRLVVFTLYKEQNATLTNSTAVFCKPSYKLQQSTINIDQDGGLKSVDPGMTLESPKELTVLALSDAVRTTIAQIDNIKIQTELATQYPMYPKHFGFNNIFLNLILRTKAEKAVEDFSDSDLLTKGAQKIFKSVAAQVAKRYFLSSKPSSQAELVSGTVEYIQERLFARIPTLRAMESLIVILVVICLYMALRPIPPTTPQDPASIARLTSMISQSHNLTLNMSSTGFLSLESLESLLSGRYSLSYLKNAHPSASKPPHFAIESYETNDQRPAPSAGKYWRPMSTSWPARTALLAIPLSIIVVLEVTFRESQRDNGLLDVASNKWTEYGSQFVPALVMVLTKLLFSSADFDLRIIDPYVQLKRGYARAKSSVLNKTVYTWKSDAVWDAYRHGRIAVGTSTFSVIIASFLTVAASGLFSTVSVPRQRSATVMRVDSFFDPETMTSNFNGTFNYTTSVGARLVVYDRMSSPPWTSGPYVLPTLSPINNGSENLNSSANVKVDLPVRRGALSCQIVPQDELTFNYTQWDEGVKKKPEYNNGLTVHWPLLDGNSCTGLKQNDKGIFQMISIKDGPFGTWTNFDPKFVNYKSPCPTSYGVYGTWEGRRPKELNVVLCWSSIEELQASAQFDMPDWKLHSLQVDEGSKKNVSSGWSTQLNLGDSVFGGSKGNASTSLDGVFTALVRNSTTNIPETQLLEYANFDKMYARIQAVYSRAAAQITNREGRYTNLTATPISLSAIATDSSTSRLKQNLVSTRILQALLIAMLVCALISLLTINPKDVLPKNPCSIAAQASLVAGSLMMSEMPAEAQWMSDKEFDALFDGGGYAMGWSEDGDGRGRFGVDVDLRPKEEKGGWLEWRRSNE